MDNNALLTDGVQFLEQLKEHNDKVWFNEHRDSYDKYILNPARDFVVAMGERLHAISPDVVADPRINRSLFRINRDIRFSKDKSPYKTHLGIFFWEGSRPKLENSGYYFHLEPGELFFGVGLHIFPKWALQIYREAVSTPRLNQALATAISQVEANGGDIGGERYKRFPAGFSQAVPQPDLLLYKGLYGRHSIRDFSRLREIDLVDLSFEWFLKLKPVHDFLKDIFH